ncbi:hypothetical protein PMZ80_009145 [Knufia obscura]|uniref:Galactose oxidase n=1 Tax=Knufia obscura TaxID=1635080 RepID=A0ABR0RE96_9EURO|nr:hypothetical protein PMZ80_009145 [Knufia obscura]
MAEAVAAFYAVETVVEGAVVGGLAVSSATAPLHANYKKIKSPAAGLAVSGSTANTIKNKIYLVGGEPSGGQGDHGVHVLSLPPDFGASRTDAGQPIDVDYELQKPVLDSERRPLQPEAEHLDKIQSHSKEQSQHSSWSRTKHASVSIEDKIYVLGGLSTASVDSRTSNTGNTTPLDSILVYDTLRSSYTILAADPAKCTEGIPEQRYSPSCTSSPYPPPMSVADGQGPSLDIHGTIFLHGGYDVSGAPLNDTWTFDVGTRAWHKFPTVVEEAVQDSSIPGRIVYVEHRLWYVNGPTVMHLDLSEHDPEHNEAASQDAATLSTGRVGSGQWQVVYPSAQQDPAVPADASSVDQKQETATAQPQSEPTGPTEHVIPITTGAGRMYLLSLSSTNPQAMHLFQIPSAAKTATSIKDTVRDKASQAITKLPDSWKSGKHEWSRVELVQKAVTEDDVERPEEGLTDFAVAGWEEYGDKIVIWGGQAEGTVKNEGWIVELG